MAHVYVALDFQTSPASEGLRNAGPTLFHAKLAPRVSDCRCRISGCIKQRTGSHKVVCGIRKLVPVLMSGVLGKGMKFVRRPLHIWPVQGL